MKSLQALPVAFAVALFSGSSFAQLGADECAAADDVTAMIGGAIAFDTNIASDTGLPATTSAEQQCFSLSEDIWFRFNATVGNIYQVDTCNTASFDTELGVWADPGGGCGALVGLGCNDDNGGAGCTGLTSLIQVTATESVMYVQLGYFSTAGGVFGNGTLQITDLGPDPCTTLPDDGLEDNDDCTTPNAQGAGSDMGLFVSTSDADYYEVTVPAAQILTVDLTFVDASGDVDLELFDAGCVTSLDTSFTTSDNEQATWANGTGAAATVIIAVTVDGAGGSDCNTYDMDIAFMPDPCQAGTDDALEDNDDCSTPTVLTPGTQTGLFVSKTDSDFYQVNVPAGDQIDVSLSFIHAMGDVDVFLYDDNANCVAMADLVRGFSASDDEFITWTNTTGAAIDYLIEVNIFPLTTTADCNNYDMTIFVGPDPCIAAGVDAFEDNDDCTTAVAIGSGLNTGLTVQDTDDDYYLLTVADGVTLTINAFFTDAIADLDIEVYDSLTGCQADTNIGGGFSTSDDETFMVTNTTGADVTYILRVYLFAGTCNIYDLEIIGAGPGGLGTNYCVGAVNSSGLPGVISGEGSANAANQDVTLIAEQLPAPNTPGIFFFGPTQIQVAFGDGFRCVGWHDPPRSAAGLRRRHPDRDAHARLQRVLRAGPGLWRQPELPVLVPRPDGHDERLQPHQRSEHPVPVISARVA